MKNPKPRNVTRKTSWMPCPKIDMEYPGLAFMCPLNELIVVKQTDALHDVIGGKHTDYTIFNNEGQKVFLVIENRRCRKFDLKIFNRYGNEIIQVKMPCKRYLNKVLVWAPPGNFVGVVKELKSCVSTFLVQNWYGIVVYKIRARGLFNYMYKILWRDVEIGKVANNWSMEVDEALNMKHFGVSFPVGMSVVDKAVMIGACFLIGCLKY